MEEESPTNNTATNVRDVMDGVDEKESEIQEGDFREVDDQADVADDNNAADPGADNQGAPTYAEIAGAINTAETVEDINAAAEMISLLDDETQQNELTELYEDRRAAIVAKS